MTFALDSFMSESSPVMSVISAPLLFAHQRLRVGHQGRTEGDAVAERRRRIKGKRAEGPAVSFAASQMWG